MLLAEPVLPPLAAFTALVTSLTSARVGLGFSIILESISVATMTGFRPLMLLAIISYNPPPFTILDEVEAALDEANSRRLARIFGELSDKTQFIIITHNRETMRHADTLYGVTMGDDGVSQLLSVTLDQIKDDDGDGEIDEIV